MRRAARNGLLTAGALGTWAAASGFPTRLGLTRAQALVSMPGDLVLPTAHLQADRAGGIHATPQQAWSTVYDIVAEYEDLWGCPLEPVYEEVPQLMVLKTPDSDESETPLHASLALTFTEGVDGDTDIHVRERYLAEGARARIQALALMARSYFVARLSLRAVRRALATNGRINS